MYICTRSGVHLKRSPNSSYYRHELTFADKIYFEYIEYLQKLTVNMVYKSTVLYPNEDDTKFDLDYYLATHMPLVGQKWKQYGLTGWDVIKHDATVGGAAPKYLIEATLVWESKEAAEKATTGPEAQEVFGDVPNFTNKQPVLFSGNPVGSATL